MDKSVREKESTIKALKEGISERGQELEEVVRGLESKLEEGEIKLRQLEWAKKDAEKDMRTTIDRLDMCTQSCTYISSIHKS